MFTAKHMWAIANAIAANHATYTHDVAVALADLVAANSSGFKRDKFMKAAGWEHKPDDVAAVRAA